MLLGTLGASLSGNISAGKEVENRAGEIKKVAKQQKKTRLWKRNGFLMLPNTLTNFTIQKYQNEHRFNGVYSGYNLPKRHFTELKDEGYIINLDEYADIGTYWIALYIQNNEI